MTYGRSLVSFCERAGMQVARSSTRMQSIGLWPDALVPDILPVKGNGNAVIAELRRACRLGDVRLIVCTAPYDDDSSRKHRQLGEMVFLHPAEHTAYAVALRLVCRGHSITGPCGNASPAERRTDHATATVGG